MEFYDLNHNEHDDTFQPPSPEELTFNPDKLAFLAEIVKRKMKRVVAHGGTFFTSRKLFDVGMTRAGRLRIKIWDRPSKPTRSKRGLPVIGTNRHDVVYDDESRQICFLSGDFTDEELDLLAKLIEGPRIIARYRRLANGRLVRISEKQPDNVVKIGDD